MDRNTAIEKIKKCLALSKSPNEHEAAAALRQAQKLMETHDVDEETVDDMAIDSDFVDHDDYKYADRKPMIIQAISGLMRQVFDVKPVWECSPTYKHRVRYFGTRSAVVIAVYSHAVVYRAVNASWRKYLSEHPHLTGVRNARASFVLGWCRSVRDKVSALNPDPEIAARIERKMLEHYATDLVSAKCGSKRLYRGVHDAGSLRGQDFDINRPIDSDRRYIGHDR